MNVLILGGSGLIGKGLARELLGEGHQVVILSRNPPAARVSEGTALHAWDGQTSQGWVGLFEQADAVVNLAGESIGAKPWSEERKQQILASRLAAGNALATAARAASRRPEVVVQASAIGYYGPREAERLDENSPAGEDFMAKLVMQWENATRELESAGCRRVIVRSGLVLDKNEGILPRFLLPFRLFVGGPMGSGRQGVSWIHIRDEARAIVYLIENRQARGAFNLTAPNPLSNAEFGQGLARALRRPYWLPVPAVGLRLALGEMATLILDGQYVMPAGLLQSGFQFAFPRLDAALQELLAA